MSIFKRFGSDRSGATAMIFGLAVIPVMMAAGAAVDYSRAPRSSTFSAPSTPPPSPS